MRQNLPGRAAFLLSLVCGLFLGCDSSSSSSSDPTLNNGTVDATVTDTTTNDEVDAVTINLEQNGAVTATGTTDANGDLVLTTQNGVQPGSFTLVASRPGFSTFVLVDANRANVSLDVQSLTAPVTDTVIIASSGLPASLLASGSVQAGASGRFAPFVPGTVGPDVGTGQPVLQGFGPPGTPFAMTTAAGIPEAITAFVVDLSVPATPSHPTYLAVATFDQGANVAAPVSLSFEDITADIGLVQGRIVSTVDYDLASDPISLRAVGFTGAPGLVGLSGIHQNNAIIGTGQSADFGIPTNNFLFVYDTVFNDALAYEASVSGTDIASTHWRRGTKTTLSPAPVLSLLAPPSFVIVDGAASTVRPTVRWSHPTPPGIDDGLVRVTFESTTERIDLVLSGAASEVELPASVSLSAATTYTVSVEIVWIPDVRFEDFRPLVIEELATDLVQRTTTWTVP